MPISGDQSGGKGIASGRDGMGEGVDVGKRKARGGDRAVNKMD